MGLTLQDYLDNDIGIEGFTRRLFYPVKPRSCDNCEHGFPPFKNRGIGCYLNFEVVEIPSKEPFSTRQKPLGKCYKVPHDCDISDLHADIVSCKVEKLRAAESEASDEGGDGGE